MSKMNRARFLRLASLSAGASLFLPGCQSAPGPQAITRPPEDMDPIHWRMVTTWPPRFPVLGEGCALFAEWVKAMSGGLLNIQVYGAGELVPGMEVFDAVSSGTAPIGSAAAYYWAGKIPAAQFFGAVPFGMNAQQMSSWLFSGGGLALWEEIYAPFDLIPIPGGNTGVQMGGWFRKEINQIEDLKGLKMRIPGLGGKVLERAGGTAVLSSGNEIYTNLERGVIDATEWIGPYHDARMGFQDIAPYYYFPGWHEPGSELEILLHKPTFDALPLWLQEIIRTAAMRLRLWTLAEFDNQNGRFLTQLQQTSGLSLRRFPEEVLSRLKELTREILNDLIADDPLSRKVHDAYFAHMAAVQPWFDISEKEYYRFSDLPTNTGSETH